MFGCDYRFVCDAQELDALWEHLDTGILLARGEAASAFVLFADGDIAEVWASEYYVPYNDATYYRVK